MDDRPAVAAIIVAAGAGRRLGRNGPRKQYRDLSGEPILSRALRPFIEHPAISPVIVVLPADDVESPPEWLAALPVLCVAGGAERTDSVRNGLAALDERTTIVLIHDGARPFVSGQLLARIFSTVTGATGEAVIPGLPLTDTVKEVDGTGLVVRTVPRDRLWQVQTPQAFPAKELRRVHAEAARSRLTFSDDAALFEHFGLVVRVVEGDADNIKVTTSRDLALAQLLAHRTRGST